MSAGLPYPANLEAEQAVLGSIMIDPELMTVIELNDKDFFGERHQVIYQSMRSLWDSGMPIDFTLLTDEIERTGKLGTIVTTSDLSSLLDNTPTALYGQHYAAIVKRASIARQYIYMAQKLVEMAFEDQNVDTLYSWIMEQVAIINSGKTDDKALMLWEESFEVFRQILAEQQARLDEGDAGWTWPWDSWTSILGEAQPGMPVLGAAATGVGKTTFVECIAEHWARQGKRVVIVHLELNRKIMLARRMTRHTAIDVRSILSGKLVPAQMQVIDQADRFMQDWIGNIHYLHAPGWSAERIVKELTKLYEQGACDGFLIDYMQKVQPSQNQVRMFRDNIYARQADDAERFKTLAESKEIRCFLLSQLTKEAQDIQFDLLSLSNLRGTQEVADKVNVVALFHRQTLAAGKVDENGRELVRAGGLDVIVRTKIDKNTLGEHGAIEQVIVPEQFNIFDK